MSIVSDTVASAADGAERTRRLSLVAVCIFLTIIPLVTFLGNRNHVTLREDEAWSMAGHNSFDRKNTFRPKNLIGGPIQKELLLAIQLAATANGTVILTVRISKNSTK